MTKFKEIINGELPVLVDFYADWCGPCKAMQPALDSFARAFSEQLRVIKVNVDNNPSAAVGYQIQSLPTLVLFYKGQPIWRQSGALSRIQLEQEVLPALSNLTI
jgi:thioredoxin 1